MREGVEYCRCVLQAPHEKSVVSGIEGGRQFWPGMNYQIEYVVWQNDETGHHFCIPSRGPSLNADEVGSSNRYFSEFRW